LLKWRLLLFNSDNMPNSFSNLTDLFGLDRGGRLQSLFLRDQLSIRERTLCSIACLQAVGDSGDLEKILRFAVDGKIDLVAIYETMLQGYLFCGYPRAIESFICLDNILQAGNSAMPGPGARMLDSSDTLMARGTKTAQFVHKDKFAKIHGRISAICPDLGYLMIAEGYGHILCRPELGLQERELAVLSSLTALEAHRQLNSHIRGALNVGCSNIQTLEAIITDIIWVEREKVRNAVEIWRKITGDAAPIIGNDKSLFGV